MTVKQIMELKKLTFFILTILPSLFANGQYLFTQEITAQERLAEKKRAELKILSYKLVKSDSTYFYVENYNRSGQLISYYDSEFGVTRYDHNISGKRIRAIQIVENKPDTVYEAHYICDTLLFKVKRDNNLDYNEELF